MKPYYDEDGITIYHADCRDVLPDLPKADLMLTDPPYGVAHRSGFDATWQGTAIQGDDDTALRDWVIAQSVAPAGFCFGSWKRPRPAGTRAVLIWDKGPAFGMGDLAFPWKCSYEEIYVLGNGFAGRRDESVLRGHLVVTWESKGRWHPNAKPVSLMAYLISKVPSAHFVIDPCCGTGPTLRAAKDLGCRAIGIEIEERYCEIAAKRLAQRCLSFEYA